MMEQTKNSIRSPRFRIIDTYFKGVLKNGDTIKVALDGERFWCIIQNIESDDKIICEIDNDLINNDLINNSYKTGDLVIVKRKNIFEKYEDSEEQDKINLAFLQRYDSDEAYNHFQELLKQTRGSGIDCN